MATKKTPPAQEQEEKPQAAETASQPKAETAAQTPAPKKPAPPAKQPESQKTKAGWVMAKLKARHCEGGVCKEAGQEMRMTRGTYERLKKYGRVE